MFATKTETQIESPAKNRLKVWKIQVSNSRLWILHKTSKWMSKGCQYTIPAQVSITQELLQLQTPWERRGRKLNIIWRTWMILDLGHPGHDIPIWSLTVGIWKWWSPRSVHLLFQGLILQVNHVILQAGVSNCTFEGSLRAKPIWKTLSLHRLSSVFFVGS